MKPLLLLLLLALLCVCGARGGLLGRLLHRETPVETTTPAPPPLFINNNLPAVEPGCTAHYSCSKKLTSVPAPRPCVKYCLKRIECPNNVKLRGKPNQCVELDETQVLAQLAEDASGGGATGGTSGATTEKIMEVAMIDFPCQPGYLPDSRGRCREIW
ncbi:hypothetical protein KR222_005023 [Zaprionus bogoriensis]|nr:hypothetical protein KR222_005023 [Zaprionus bogoriensis]